MKKKLLPALLALVMVLGMLPLAVFAAPAATAPTIVAWGYSGPSATGKADQLAIAKAIHDPTSIPDPGAYGNNTLWIVTENMVASNAETHWAIWITADSTATDDTNDSVFALYESEQIQGTPLENFTFAAGLESVKDKVIKDSKLSFALVSYTGNELGAGLTKPTSGWTEVPTDGNIYYLANDLELDEKLDGVTATPVTGSKNIKYKVTFTPGEGATGSAEPVYVAVGGKVTAPTVTKTGSTLDGWYNGQTKWDFENGTVSEPVTLTAKWTANTPDPGPGGEEITATLHTTWQADWTEGGNDVHRDQAHELNLAQAVTLTQEQVTALEGQLVEYIAVSNFPEEATSIKWTYQRGTGAPDNQTATIADLKTDHRCGALGDVTVIKQGVSFAAKDEDNVWTLKAGDFVQSIEFFKADTSLGKVENLTLSISKITVQAPAQPPVEDAIEGTVTGTGDEAVLKPADTDVKNKVTSDIADDTKDAVEITVVPASGTAKKTEVPLNTGALEALEVVTKPVVIETPQGKVALPANTLVEKTDTDALVTFKMENTAKSATVETYDVGFYKDDAQGDPQEVEIKDLPAAKSITLTFKTNFTVGDKVIVECDGTAVKTVTVGAESLVTLTTTHLSTWTLRKEASVDGGYVAFDNTGSDKHLTPGYVFIANGQTTYGEVKENDNYLVQIKTTGGTILSLVKADSEGLKIPCNKTGEMSVWQVGSESDITAIKNSTINGKQVIYQEDLATMPEYVAPGTP